MTTPAPAATINPTLINFGCRLNATEAEAMRELAAAAGDPDLVVVNSCAVTEEAVRQARQQIRRIKRERPGARIIVAGCAAQVEGARFAAMPEVARVLGNVEKLEARHYRLNDGSNDPLRVGDIMAGRAAALSPSDSAPGARARAFLEIQTGCDHRCSFCIIPFARGDNRSVPAAALVERVRRLADQGYNEVVLTGVDIASWGRDLPAAPTLGALVQQLLAGAPRLPRLRLSTLDPALDDDALLDALADPRLMPQLHLSVQAGDDIILKRMKRRHGRREVVTLCARARARRPDIVFGADFIAGFPTESEAMFEASLRLVADAGLDYLHVFPFSPRAGTPAARMPQAPVALRRERAGRLRRLGAERRQALYQSMIGRETSLLIESRDGDGHTPHFASARVSGPVRRGSIIPVRLTAIDGDALVAEPLSREAA